MNRQINPWMFRICLCAALVLMAAPAAQAKGELPRHQVIDNVSIYLGVLPLQMAMNEADELKLPARVYGEKNRYYVLFALFDKDTGKRIDAADVKVRVEALGGLDFSQKQLKPVHVEKLVSFGNYFRMADPDLYHIDFWVTPSGSDKVVSGTFDYQRPPE